MARAPVKQIPLSSQLQPQAQLVDTYVRPAISPLRGLAESLGTFDKSLQELITTRDRQAEQDAELKGRASFYSDSGGEIAKAVTEGKLPAYMSPFYMRGFKNAQGAAAGDAIRTKYQDAWDNWQGKDNDDPKAFDTFFHEFIKGSVGTEDPDVIRGVLPAVEALQANARTQYNQYRHDRAVNGSLTAHGALISTTVQDGVDDGLLADKGADYPAIFGNVNKVVTESLAKGDPGGKAVDTFIDVMSAKILETKDPKLLDWFDQKVPGRNYTYGSTPHGLEVRNATVNNLETIANKQRADFDAQQRAEQKRLKDTAETSIIDGLFANPSAPLNEDMLKQAEKNGNPRIRVDAAQWRETVTKGTPSDPHAIQGFYSKIIAGEVSPQAAMRDALAQGVFSNAEDLKAGQAFVQSFKGQQGRIEETRNSAAFRDILETIRTRTIAKDPLFNPIAGWSNEGFEASTDFRQLVARWLINNPEATPLEIEEQVSKFGKAIFDRIGVPPGGDSSSDAQAYERDPALPFPNGWSNGSNQQDGTEVGPDADVREWERKQAITPEQKAALQKQAERSGMEYPEFIRERALKPKPKATAPDGTPVKPTAYDPADPDLGEGDRANTGLSREQATAYIDQAFAQAQQGGMGPDDQETILLDLIGKGESNGNYNAVFGNPDNQRDLSAFTLDEILGHQQDARRKGLASTAIGKYQFLYKTLRGLKAEMGLSGNEKFTPKLQDHLGRALLYRRGLEAFRAGRITKRQFALSLSQEWAALPNPNTGRSFYAGDGLNASRVPRQAVYSALGFMPVSLSSPKSTNAFDGFNLEGGGKSSLTFNHPEQEAGVPPQLKDAVASAYAELGIPQAKVLSGFRGANHPVEAAKKGGPGEHSRGAVDLDMAGMTDEQRAGLVQRLIAKGVKRFITYSNSPDMLHIDLKDQNGDGSPYFMHDKSARNLKRAPQWLQSLSNGNSAA